MCIRDRMRKLGFQRGRYNPCLYYHESRNLRTFLHGDDFATVGTKEEVNWFRQSLEKRFEIKSSCVGSAVAGVWAKGTGSPSAPAPTATNGEDMVEGSECRLLNRVIRCTPEGWEVEPDQRHVDMLIQGLALKTANGVAPPGEHEARGKEEDNEVELGPGEATTYRSIAARANYLAQDRTDIGFATKELSRRM